MASAPIYIGQAPGLTPAPSVEVARGASIGQALSGLGEVVGNVAQLVARGGEETRAAQATTEYLTRVDALEKQYREDPDFQNAPVAFAGELAKVESDILGRPFSEERRAALQLSFRRVGLSSQGAVDTAALTRNSQAAEANLDTQEGLWYRRFKEAGTEAQRGAVLADWDASIDGNVTAGTISLQSAETRKLRRGQLLDEASALSMIRSRPDIARAALDDPKQFPNLSIVDRERLITTAEGQADEIAIDTLTMRAQFKPELASMEVGRIVDPTHVETIFDSAVIPQESGGRADAESGKGAVGVSQLMLGTARDMAKKLGLADVAALDDASLKDTLKADPVLNQQLGLAYFGEQIGSYEGALPIALAAYNAGPGEANRWKALAEERFGPNPTPAQFLSVVDFKETSDYITKIYRRMGARLDTGISPAGAFKALRSVGEAIAGAERRRDQVIKDLASAGRSGNDFADMIKAGFDVDLGQVAEYRRQQQQAADRGDRDAANAVRGIDEAVAAKPFVDLAWRTPPAELDTAIAGLEAQLANSGSASSADYRQLKAFKAVAEEIRSKAKQDPVALGARAGLFRPVAIDTAGDFSSGPVREALGYRDLQATAAASTYNAPLLPFSPGEAEALKERWRDASESDRLAMLTGMSGTMRQPAYEAAVGQIAGDDPRALAAGIFARERPELARMILRGSALMNVEGVGKTINQDIRPALEATIKGDLYPPGSRALKTVVDAALAVYVAERGGHEALFSAADQDGFAAALEAVTGPIVDRNGIRVAAPPSLDAGSFETILDSLEPADLPAGAIDRDGNPIPAAALGRDAVLRQLSPAGTRYAVGMYSSSASDRFAPVMDATGRPLVIDMREIRDRRAGRPVVERSWFQGAAGALGAGWMLGLPTGIRSQGDSLGKRTGTMIGDLPR